MHSRRGRSTLRLIALAAWTLWSGGFAFYGAFVIDAAHHVLGDHTTVGFITQRVALAEHGTLAAALGISALVAALRAAPRTRLFVASWIAAALGLAAMALMHRHLGAFLDQEARIILDRTTFYARHRIYIATATIAWLAGLVHAWVLSEHPNSTEV